MPLWRQDALGRLPDRVFAGKRLIQPSGQGGVAVLEVTAVSDIVEGMRGVIGVF